MAIPSTGWFDVIQENDDVVDVIVPAYGQCRIRKADVTDWRELPSLEQTTAGRTALHNHGIRSLKLVVHDLVSDIFGLGPDGPYVRRLLKLVGRPLVSLDLDIILPRADTFLDAVWPACPNLKTIHLEPTRLPSLEYFIDAYETNKCRVPSLSLGHCTVEEPESRMRLIEALEGIDPRTKIAATLKELRFSEDPSDAYDYFSLGQLDEIAKKLSTNGMLRYIDLGILGDAMECYMVPMFEPLQAQVLRSQSTPLSSRCKCALLSVVAHASEPEHSTSIVPAHPIAQLDSGVLQSILRFAAQPVKRSISLRHRPWKQTEW